MSHEEEMYHLCCRYKGRWVYIHTRGGRIYYGQIVDVDRKNVYFKASPPGAYGTAGKEGAQVNLALGHRRSTVSINEVQFGWGGIATLGLYSILAIVLAPRFGGFGYGGFL